MNLNYKYILENELYLDTLKLIPDDIKNHINALKKVKRFQFKEYPKNILIDDTKKNTLKCVNIAKTLALDTNYPSLIRTLWIHDIPELITKDLTVIEKYRNKNAASEFDVKEMIAAEQLLNKDDQELLKAFNAANNFLKGNTPWNEKTVSLEAVFAKLIDNSEGNMTFHYFISRWAASERYDKTLLPPRDSLLHSFITNQKFLSRIEQFTPKEYNKDLIAFIANVLENIKRLWFDVPADRIPDELRVYLK